jgi:hypothetical protein
MYCIWNALAALQISLSITHCSQVFVQVTQHYHDSCLMANYSHRSTCIESCDYYVLICNSLHNGSSSTETEIQISWIPIAKTTWLFKKKYRRRWQKTVTDRAVRLRWLLFTDRCSALQAVCGVSHADRVEVCYNNIERSHPVTIGSGSSPFAGHAPFCGCLKQRRCFSNWRQRPPISHMTSRSLVLTLLTVSAAEAEPSELQ